MIMEYYENRYMSGKDNERLFGVLGFTHLGVLKRLLELFQLSFELVLQ